MDRERAECWGSGGGGEPGSDAKCLWLPAPAGSQWISTQLTDGDLPPASSGLIGTYTFELTFNTIHQGGSLGYAVAADNQVTVEVFLDGGLLGSAFSHPGNLRVNPNTSPGCAFLPAGSAGCPPSLAAGLVGPGTIGWGPGGAGTILIRATVVNSQPPVPSPVGFLLVGSADVVTPEPSALLMFGAGTLALGAVRRSRRA